MASITLRLRLDHARSIRNALDRMRLRLASRVFSGEPLVSRDDLMTIREEDVRASRVYTGGLTGDGVQAKESV